jgi:hypothetical protein
LKRIARHFESGTSTRTANAPDSNHSLPLFQINLPLPVPSAESYVTSCPIMRGCAQIPSAKKKIIEHSDLAFTFEIGRSPIRLIRYYITVDRPALGCGFDECGNPLFRDLGAPSVCNAQQDQIKYHAEQRNYDADYHPADLLPSPYQGTHHDGKKRYRQYERHVEKRRPIEPPNYPLDQAHVHVGQDSVKESVFVRVRWRAATKEPEVRTRGDLVSRSPRNENGVSRCYRARIAVDLHHAGSLEDEVELLGLLVVMAFGGLAGSDARLREALVLHGSV